MLSVEFAGRSSTHEIAVAGGTTYTVTLTDDTVLVGTATNQMVEFTATYGRTDIELSDVLAFKEGFLTLADGSKLKGKFSSSTLSLRTARDVVAIPFASIIAITRSTDPSHAVANSTLQSGLVSPAEIVNRAITAMGGREVLGKFRTVKTTGKSTVVNGRNTFNVEWVRHVKLPNKVKMDEQTQWEGPFAALSTGRTSHMYYLVGNDSNVTGEARNRLVELLHESECFLLVPLLEGDWKLDCIPTSGTSGVSVIKARKAGKPDTTLTFDGDSGLMIGLDYEGQRGGKRGVRTSYQYGDFRTISGAKLATKCMYYEDGNLVSTTTILSVDTLEDSEFPDPRANSKVLPSQSPRSIGEIQAQGTRERSVNSRTSGTISVRIEGGEIGIGDSRRPYQAVEFELTPGDVKEIAFRRQDKPMLFRYIQVQFSADGSTFFFDPGMKQIQIRSEDSWRTGQTYYPKEVDNYRTHSGAKNIRIHIRFKGTSDAR